MGLMAGGGTGSYSNHTVLPNKTTKAKAAPKPAPAPAPRPAPKSYAAPTPVYNPYVAPVASVAPAVAAAPAAAPAPAPAAPAVKVPTQAAFIASDATFQNQHNSLVKALTDYISNQNTQKAQYNADFGKSQKSLGWDPTKKSWNMTDLNTASGKANTDQQNDFAGRGLLQSSLYGTAKNDLLRSLGTQESDLESSKQNYLDNLANQLTTYKNQNTVSQQQAKADALARYAAQYAGLS